VANKHDLLHPSTISGTRDRMGRWAFASRTSDFAARHPFALSDEPGPTLDAPDPPGPLGRADGAFPALGVPGDRTHGKQNDRCPVQLRCQRDLSSELVGDYRPLAKPRAPTRSAHDSRCPRHERGCGRIASGWSHRHTVMSLIVALMPARRTSRAISAVLNRESGTPKDAGNSHASALTWTTTSGGRARGRPEREC